MTKVLKRTCLASRAVVLLITSFDSFHVYIAVAVVFAQGP